MAEHNITESNSQFPAPSTKFHKNLHVILSQIFPLTDNQPNNQKTQPP